MLVFLCLENVLEGALNHLRVHIAAKVCFKSAKNYYFSYSAFWSTGQRGEGGYSPGYATVSVFVKQNC